MIVYLARDIPAFVMYCVNGESGSSLLIESTDSMIYNPCRSASESVEEKKSVIIEAEERYMCRTPPVNMEFKHSIE